jgi:hypothetical protein
LPDVALSCHELLIGAKHFQERAEEGIVVRGLESHFRRSDLVWLCAQAEEIDAGFPGGLGVLVIERDAPEGEGGLGARAGGDQCGAEEAELARLLEELEVLGSGGPAGECCDVHVVLCGDVGEAALADAEVLDDGEGAFGGSMSFG